MKTAKLTLGIISIVLSLIVLFQSCAVGLGTALSNNTNDTSGGTGIIFTILLIAAGIVGIVGRSSKGGTIAAAIIYAIDGLIGTTATGMFADLNVWGAISFIFAAVFLLSVFVGQTYPSKRVVTQPTSGQSNNDKTV
jgi:FtsH-binding integral membrane protein